MAFRATLRNQNGNAKTPTLNWNDEKLNRNANWLDNKWNSNNRIVLLDTFKCFSVKCPKFRLGHFCCLLFSQADFSSRIKSGRFLQLLQQFPQNVFLQSLSIQTGHTALILSSRFLISLLLKYFLFQFSGRIASWIPIL